ncbi:reverse transcriptase/maturase family protein [Metalysinibacillus jejuensis]|uniref:reverse transcriptase/maturase family protein n=1 Tax=Metalysinibacillus jejuensis TaxID=914327 RepID=UPI000D365BC2|nr:reverse transcriptase/maturase family protein [Metalysinibacillus jejuensis]
MRNSEVVLNNLVTQATDENYRFDRLIRNLYNEDFYLRAIGKLYANSGAGTKGSDGTSISGFSNKDIEKIIDQIRNETYEPTPLRRVYIPKKNGKKRPLGMPNFKDKLVQEVIRLILEAIYEPIFLNTSHGFRPNRSCHTAINDIDVTFTGIKWFVEGDIKGCFDNINQHILIKLLQKRIKDEKFLRLINKFLKCGYIEDWVYHKTYSGTPQGGIMSPILANIYLHELDKYMANLQNGFEKGSPNRKTNPAYSRTSAKLHRRRVKYKKNPNEETLKEIKALEKEMLQMPYYDPEDESYKRLRYVRYADDFLIGIIGSKEDAERIKRKVGEFLKNELDLELSEEKTLVTHVSDRAKFLGFEITKRVPKIERVSYSHGSMRKANGNLEFYMPHDYAVKWLKDARAITFKKDGTWKPVARYSLTNLSDLELISIANSEIRGIYNYFKIAKNIHRQMSTIIYAIEYSTLGTMARKRKSSVGKIKESLRIGKYWGTVYDTKKGKKTMLFFNSPITREKFSSTKTDESVDEVFNLMKHRGRTELERRLSACECEICGSFDIDGEFHIHHTNKLKNLKKKTKLSYWMKEMIARNRKTLIVCTDCHWKIHTGSL